MRIITSLLQLNRRKMRANKTKKQSKVTVINANMTCHMSETSPGDM